MRAASGIQGSVSAAGERVTWPGNSTSLAWHLKPSYPLRSTIPFREIMKTMKAGLDANLGDHELAQALRKTIQHDEQLAGLIDAEAPLSGGPLARAELTFEASCEWRLSVRRPPGPAQQDAAWRIAADRVPAGSWRSLIRKEQAALPPVVTARPHQPSPAGGLIRREHASIEVNSGGGSRLLFDPIFRSPLLHCATDVPAPEPGVAAAFVTHSHSDHFDLATLDYLAAEGATTYVPPVPRHSVLAEDMHGALALCGLPGEVREWGSLTKINDITVETLPFFGEQPSARVSPAEADIRNWGNCYRVDTADFSALILADSGTDPSGSMLTAISDSVRRRGPIDIVLGCLRDFYLPFEVDGLAHYYAVLPVSGLRRDHELYRRGKLPSATLGLSGTAAACVEARAKVFLPYAHGLTGYGEPIRDNPFGPAPGVDERSACRALAGELARIGCDTIVTNWNPGDRWAPG